MISAEHRPLPRGSDSLGIRLAIALAAFALMAMLWTIAVQRVRFERTAEIAEGAEQNAILASALEEHTVRALNSSDQTLQLIQHQYAKDGRRLNLRRLSENRTFDSSIFSFIGVANERGDTVVGSGSSAPVNPKDVEYFKAARGKGANKMFIGTPVLWRATGQWVVPLWRPINRPDGSFAGIVYVALDPGYLTKFDREGGLGEHGMAILARLDGTVIAAKSGQTATFGGNTGKARLFAEQAKIQVGSFVDPERPEDGPWNFSFRTLPQYALIVAVGKSQADILGMARFPSRERTYYMAAGLASALAAFFAAGLNATLSRRRRAIDALADSEVRFRSTFDHAASGIAHTTWDGQFIQVNRKLCDIVGYKQAELMAMNVRAIVHPEDAAALFRDRTRIESGQLELQSGEYRLTRKDGSTVWVALATSVAQGPSGGAKYFISILHDITQRKRAEQALRASEERFRLIAETIEEVFWLRDPATRNVYYISPAYERVWQRSRESLRANPHSFVDAIHLEDRARVCAELEIQKTGLQASDMEYRIIQPDGAIRWIWDRGFPIHDEETGEVVCYAGIAQDITDRKQLQDRLLREANYDSLTQLPNRVLCYERLRQALIDAKRRNSIVGVLFIDLDRFKAVNDTLGHAAGDQLLEEVSQRLTQQVRANDTIGRLGGDEFAVILSDLVKAQDSASIAEKIIKALAAPLLLDGHEVFVTASVGITIYPHDGEEADTLIRNADAAMYRAKELGKNNYQFFTAEMNQQALEDMLLENDLRRGLERNEFLLHFQPKVSLTGGGITGCEALLRWQHPVRGLVSPARFIPLLEESGLIVPVGEWVIRAACSQIRAWQDAGIAPVPVAINLSARQFRHQDICATVDRALNEYGVDVRFLELEITESVAMQDPESAIVTLRELNAHSTRLAIDDFGTGYSSLSYLKRFPVDSLKLDRSFVVGLPDELDDASIARAVITMAHSLGLKVVAEGVETESQFAFLAANDCDEMQGYYFYRPLPASEFTQLLQRPHAFPQLRRKAHVQPVRLVGARAAE
jgi:diguanylate cyclase (GGDEF)-like protein/PAS domain S-box-containing protein